MKPFNPAFLAATAGSLKVILSANTAYGSATLGYGPATATSAPIVAVASGGIAPYTYLYSYVSGDATVYKVGFSPNIASWAITTSTPGTYISIWKCQVTDDVGHIAYSENITITLDILL